jgi:uncharacterized iron-regulated membrane protein
MRGLRALVIGLGVVFLILFVGFIYAFATKIGQLGTNREAMRTAPDTLPGSERRAVAWGTRSLGLKPGTRIVSMQASGAYIVLHVYTGAPGEEERLVVVDPATGGVVGVLALGPL